MLNWYQNGVNSCQLTINQRSKTNCDVNCGHQIDVNGWHQIFFTKSLCQWSFSRHILDIILIWCVDIHEICNLTSAGCQHQVYWHCAMILTLRVLIKFWHQLEFMCLLGLLISLFFAQNTQKLQTLKNIKGSICAFYLWLLFYAKPPMNCPIQTHDSRLWLLHKCCIVQLY